MSSGYEIMRKLYDVPDLYFKKIGKTHAFLILTALAFICSLLFWGLGLPSAFACFAAIAFAGVYILIIRFDLWRISLGSGLVTLFCLLPFYIFLITLAPEWIIATYPFDVLTGLRIYGVPIEEFIFWFLSGTVFGPFYEVMNGFREYRK
jgi:hypothetical protein